MTAGRGDFARLFFTVMEERAMLFMSVKGFLAVCKAVDEVVRERNGRRLLRLGEPNCGGVP